MCGHVYVENIMIGIIQQEAIEISMWVLMSNANERIL